MSNIKIGDLAIVVSSHCCGSNIGRIFTVERLEVATVICKFCKKEEVGVQLAISTGVIAVGVHRIKKIDLLPEDKTIDDDLEVSA